jgi:hypothetical protein
VPWKGHDEVMGSARRTRQGWLDQGRRSGAFLSGSGTGTPKCGVENWWPVLRNL